MKYAIAIRNMGPQSTRETRVICGTGTDNWTKIHAEPGGRPGDPAAGGWLQRGRSLCMLCFDTRGDADNKEA